MRPTIIKQLIEKSLKDSIAIVEGEDGQHFTACVISSQFLGKSRIEKQQLVYAALKQPIADGTLHAISIKAFTPEEWKSLSTSNG